MGAVRYLHRLLLGAWIGALLCFVAVVAPALFQELGPAQAGSVVRRIIPALDGYALLAAPALIVLAALYEGRPRGRGLARAILVAAMFALAGTSFFALTPRMAQLRHQAGNRISELPKDDPVRREFGRLHGISTALMLGELALALVAFGLFLRPRERPE